MLKASLGIDPSQVTFLTTSQPQAQKTEHALLNELSETQSLTCICQIFNQISKLPLQELVQFQKKLYRILKIVNNAHIKTLALQLLSSSLKEEYLPALFFQYYNDFLSDLKNPLFSQLLTISPFTSSDIPEQLLLHLDYPVENHLKWVAYEKIQYDLAQPSLLLYDSPEGDIWVSISHQVKKAEIKIECDIVYFKNEFHHKVSICNNQTLNVNLGALKKAYYHQADKSWQPEPTVLVKALLDHGFMPQLLQKLNQNTKANRENIKSRLYDYQVFNSFSTWKYSVFSQKWFEAVVGLALLDKPDADNLFHQTMLDSLKALKANVLTPSLLSVLLLRLYQYAEAKFLDLKIAPLKPKAVSAEKKEEQPEQVPQNAAKVEKKKIVQSNNLTNGKAKGNSKKPKGVGYGDGDGKLFQFQSKSDSNAKVVAYQDDKIFSQADNFKNQIISELLRLLKLLNDEHIQEVEDSALIPIMKSYYAGLSKNLAMQHGRYELFVNMLDIMKNLLNEETLHVYCMRDYGNASLFEVLSKSQTETSFHLEACKDEQAKSLISNFIAFYKNLESLLHQHGYIALTYEEKETQITNAEDIYPIIMKPLVLATSDIQKNPQWLKQMSNDFSYLAKVPPQSKMNQLIKELSDMPDHLPLQVTNSIFLRYDKERMDVMQAIVFGSSGTPYAHGAFLYNFLFCDNYPQRPPKCLLETTGHGKVRFNPNLYNCGKVCLSLLGTWGDNWIPHRSTLLQILISIQAMVMSEYVYYNEPGWESQMGTPEGEKANRAYCNIVKLANLRYAMIEQLQKPPAGFQEVIQKSFYLRKEIILKEVQQWIKEADLPASYQNSQNHTIAQPFIADPGKYKTVLIVEMENLKKEFEKLKVSISQNPQEGSKVIKQTGRKSLFELKQSKSQQFEQSQQALQDLLNQQLEVVDVEESKVEHRKFDSNSSEIQNLMSRYIGVMGLESVKQQSHASVLLVGLNVLGLETAKNLVLSGLQRLTIVDSRFSDDFGQFYKQDSAPKLQSTLNHLQGMNPYVEIDYAEDAVQALKSNQYQIVCICEIESIERLKEYESIARGLKIGVVLGEITSVIGRVFVDLGEEFVVNDKNGEVPLDFSIENIDEQGLVRLTAKHNLESGDVVQLREVQCFGEGKSLNSQFKVKVMTLKELQLQEFDGFKQFKCNGKLTKVKETVKLNFKPISQVVAEPVFDEHFIVDSDKLRELNKHLNSFVAYRAVKGQPTSLDEIKVLEQSMPKWLARTITGLIPPQAAYLGGVLCQEVLKAITHKYMPIYQCYFHSCEELIEKEQIEAQEELCLSDHLQVVLGKETIEKIQSCRLFMIGAGAIGCELLKNYSMIGLGTKGKVILTDPDVIEKSNLSRQFLFREKHIRKPKSITAANACLKMNPQMQIIARLDRVGASTEQIYSNSFFKYINIVTNALDNVQARLYVDGRCVQNQKPLIESGTLGPKGHVQVIIPHLTESYASRQDPVEENDIPYCTLKMFPEDTVHCLEWARDKFEKMFFLKMQQVKQCLQFSNQDVSTEVLETTLKFCKRRPKSIEDCVQFALNKFYKYFNYGIQDLLKAYPLDHVVNSKPFWSSPKRPPNPIQFQGNEIQMKFIMATTVLYAQANQIKIDELAPAKLIEILQNLQPKEYAQNESKLKQIQQEVQKQNEVESEQNQQLSTKELITEIVKHFPEHYKLSGEDKVEKLKDLDFLPVPIPFEKDEDENHHINFIQAATNCRAANYGLEEIDWLATKLKAGRIVPAMATTTSCIAGLQTIEVIKVLKQMKFESYKNTFLNLAVPFELSSEPGECERFKINEESVTFWSKWVVEYGKDTNTLNKLIAHLQEKYKMKVTCIKQDAKLLYQELMFIGKTNDEIQFYLNQPILLQIDLQNIEEFVDLDVSYQDGEGKEVKGCPKCRFYIQL